MIGFITDKGNVRELNEDNVAYNIGKEIAIYVVGDGMGGHNAGEVASKMAVEGVVSYVNAHYGKVSLERMLKNAVLEVNSNIYNYGKEQEGLSGMGTTIVAIFEYSNKVQIANVGDSCCFGINRDGITKLTKDHSLVQELVDSGCITAEEAKNHPRKNIITRAIGTNKDVEVDITTVLKEAYDFYLLCTDGFANDLDEQEIWRELNNCKDLNKACENLVQLVKSRGGRDNITVLVFGGESEDDR